MIGFTMGQEEVMLKAISKYGIPVQMDMVVEELAELIQATQKFKRHSCEDTHANVIEEIADVEIMIQQLKLMVGGGVTDKMDAEIQKEIDYKMNRLEGKINGK